MISPQTNEGSYPDLSPQVAREAAKLVWLSTPGADGAISRLFGKAVQQISHPLPQGTAWPQDMPFKSIFCPGHHVPLFDFGMMTAMRWYGRQKAWENSHGC